MARVFSSAGRGRAALAGAWWVVGALAAGVPAACGGDEGGAGVADVAADVVADVADDADGAAPEDTAAPGDAGADVEDAAEGPAWPTLAIPEAPLDPSCDEAPCGPGRRCREGRCVAGRVHVERLGDGRLAGAWLPAAGPRVDFLAWPAGAGGAEAWYAVHGEDGPEEPVQVTLGALDGVSPLKWVQPGVTWGGRMVDGIGAPFGEDGARIAALEAGPLGEALAMVPLELGCQPREAMAPVELAALLYPWQVILKYARPDRLDAIAARADLAACAYGVGEAAGPAPSGPRGLQLSAESPVPAVLGFWPFDDEGAAELPGLAAGSWTGETFGPCGARCRGACGASCTDVNCQVSGEGADCQKDENGENTGVAIPTDVLSCGTHDVCKLHDDCYDNCNEGYGCGSWAAAGCRRVCDTLACAADGFGTCYDFAWGVGEHDAQRLEFQVPKVNAPATYDPGLCPPPGDILGACLYGFSGAGGSTSDMMCIDQIMKKNCNHDYLKATVVIPPVFDDVAGPYWFYPGESCEPEGGPPPAPP